MTTTYFFQDDFDPEGQIEITFYDVDHVDKKPDGSARLYTTDGRMHYIRGGYIRHEDKA